MWTTKKLLHEAATKGTIMEKFEGFFLMVCPSESQTVKNVTSITQLHRSTNVS